MKPASLHLGNFATTVEEARKAFQACSGADLDIAAWLVYYEAKEAAYQDLLQKVPPLRDIPDFWRLAQNSSSVTWIPVIEREIKKILSSAVCACGAKLKWPKTICLKCSKENREARKRARLALTSARTTSTRKISTKRPKIKKTILRAS